MTDDRPVRRLEAEERKYIIGVRAMTDHVVVRMVERADGTGYRRVTEPQLRRVTGVELEGADGDEDANTVTYWYRRKVEE